MADSEWVFEEVVLQDLNCGRSTLRRRVLAGQIPAPVKFSPGGRKYYNRAQVTAAMKALFEAANGPCEKETADAA